MGRRHPSLHRQRGAVAAISGLLLLLVLCAAGGLVIDLGRLYIVKSELQTIADAAALAAAKDLDNSDTGLNKGVAAGKAIAAKNRYDFNTTLTLQNENFRFGPSPTGPWYTYAETLGNSEGRTFVEVDTSAGGSTPQSVITYLMRVVGVESTATLGYAVAGRYVNSITPIGVCAIDPAHRTASYNYGDFTELVEYGFRRGMSYNIFELGKLAGSSPDPYLINPVNSPPNECVEANSSANATAPFMCVGNSAVLPTGSGDVYTNTGMTSALSKALNSRFNDYTGGSQCEPSSAPPDVNVREYPCRGNGTNCVRNVPGTVSVTPPIAWMDNSGTSLPNRQAIETFESSSALYTPKYALPHEAPSGKVWPSVDFSREGGSLTQAATFENHGTLWAYTPPVRADGVTVIEASQANNTIGTNNPNTDKLMYGRTSGPSAFYFENYPTTVGSGFPNTRPAAPYNQTGNADYFEAPSGRTGEIDRRVLNIVLVDCRTPPVGSAACGRMSAVGIGKFFMLTKADFSGSPKKLFVEFTGLIEPVPTSEVKLYK
jgi:Flp pilus assembly protein TadG